METDKKERTKKLYIPSRVKVDFEPIKGYSTDSLKKVIISSIVISILSVIIGMITNELSYGILLWILSIGIVVIIFREDELNMNIVDFIQVILNFYREQQHFDYVYNDEFDD